MGLLLPTDDDDSRNAIMEVRAGAGGDEAVIDSAAVRFLPSELDLLPLLCACSGPLLPGAV